MQRIDENTYIDESLVTCAEYQLFIDEMREQGKYYQPDHWNSYQFQEGMARLPVLGVRRSDAIIFCDWLNQQEYRMWKFRLPTGQEAIELPIEPYLQLPLGHWLNEEDLFAWIGSVPNDVRQIKDLFLKEIDPDLTQALQRHLHEELAQGQYFDLDDDEINSDHHDPYGARERAQKRREESISTFTRAQTNHEFRLKELERIRIRIFEQSFPLHLDKGQALNQEHELFLSQALDRSPARNANLLKLLDNVLNVTRVLVFNRRFNEIFDHTFNLFMDLFTLQERIIGRSPAFEGIRLVKERVR